MPRRLTTYLRGGRLESSLSDLADHVGGTTLEYDVDQLRDDVDGLQQTVSDMFDALLNSALKDVYTCAC
jgi:hypothetical protein